MNMNVNYLCSYCGDVEMSEREIEQEHEHEYEHEHELF